MHARLNFVKAPAIAGSLDVIDPCPVGSGERANAAFGVNRRTAPGKFRGIERAMTPLIAKLQVDLDLLGRDGSHPVPYGQHSESQPNEPEV